MDFFNYQGDALYAEHVPLQTIAEQVGTPCYVYSRATLTRHWHAFDNALGEYPHLICYAVKANSNLAVLNVLAKLGSGFDIVSVGELERVLAAGGPANKIVFSGVGKLRSEIERALTVGIYCFNVESSAELELIAEVAQQQNVQASIALRINPDIDAQTHPYISTGLKQNKFGVTIAEALPLYLQAKQHAHLNPIGMACHIGSQLTSTQPFLDALDRLLLLYQQLHDQQIDLQHLDLGGGLGICYQDETPPHPSDYAKAILRKLRDSQLKLILEPGRAIAANSGVLLTKILFTKQGADRKFLLVDAAMNDLLRPALYSAWHNIIPVHKRDDIDQHVYDIVGPVCETGDFLGRQRALRVQSGDLLAVRSAGAYAFSMSSNYNTRPRAAEVLVDERIWHIVRQRETIADLFSLETIIKE